MKNVISIFVFAVAAILSTSCNKDWEEEQYEHYVSFRAPLPGFDKFGVGSGTTPIFVPYTRKSEGVPVAGSGKSSYQLPMIVSGSTTNDRDITVHVAHDPDTLVQLNNARFSTRTDLFYRDMGAADLDYASYAESSPIVAGQRVGLMNIDFDFNSIDMSDKWVLPIEIKSGYDYVPNPRKNYSKALLRVFPFNDYSGDYAGEQLLYKPLDDNGNPAEGSITKSLVRGYVVDDETIFTYAGIVDEDYPNRKMYKIYFKFIPNSELGGIVEISCPNAEEIGFETTSVQTSYRRVSMMDAVRPYLEHRYIVINNVDYYYNYILSDDGAGNKSYVRYYITGTMTLSRDVNTQIPDEDQAIEW